MTVWADESLRSGPSCQVRDVSCSCCALSAASYATAIAPNKAKMTTASTRNRAVDWVRRLYRQARPFGGGTGGGREAGAAASVAVRPDWLGAPSTTTGRRATGD